MASNEAVVLGNIYKDVHCSIIYNSQNQEQIKCTSLELVKYIMCCFAAIEEDAVALY